MTNRELIECLQKQPLDVDVRIVWEGTVREVVPENIYLAKGGVVVLDADNSLHKRFRTQYGVTYPARIEYEKYGLPTEEN